MSFYLIIYIFSSLYFYIKLQIKALFYVYVFVCIYLYTISIYNLYISLFVLVPKLPPVRPRSGRVQSGHQGAVDLRGQRPRGVLGARPTNLHQIVRQEKGKRTICNKENDSFNG